MKNMIKVSAFLMLVLVPLFFAAARPNNAPGIQKKTLEILNVEVVISGSVATIIWETSAPAEGGVGLFDYLIGDWKTGTRHSVSVENVSPGIEYQFHIVSFSSVFGSAVPYEGVFRP